MSAWLIITTNFTGAHLFKNSRQRLTGTNMTEGPEIKKYTIIMDLIVCAVLDLWLQ